MTVFLPDFNDGFARAHRCLVALNDDCYRFFIPRPSERVRFEATIAVHPSLYTELWWAANGRSYFGGTGPVRTGVLISADLDAVRLSQAADDVCEISFGFRSDKVPAANLPVEVRVEFSVARAADVYGTSADRVLPIGYTRFPYRVEALQPPMPLAPEASRSTPYEERSHQKRDLTTSACLDRIAALGDEVTGLYPMSGYRDFLFAAITELDRVFHEADCS